MAITEAASPEQLSALEALVWAARPSSVVLQLRDRSCSARELYARAKVLANLAREAGQLAIVGERIDVALAAAAHGVHLPGASMLPSDARRLLAGKMWLSRAVHGPDELSREELSVLDAVVLSPVLAPRKGRAPLGLGTLTEWTKRLRQQSAELQVFALGGISGEGALDCVAAGASGVAAMEAVRQPAPAKRLVEALAIAR
jgi:thiamine-phosphate pyrophosphorylase